MGLATQLCRHDRFSSVPFSRCFCPLLGMSSTTSIVPLIALIGTVAQGPGYFKYPDRCSAKARPQVEILLSFRPSRSRSQAMSRRAQAALAGAILFSGFTIWAVHYQQEQEHEVTDYQHPTCVESLIGTGTDYVPRCP